MTPGIKTFCKMPVYDTDVSLEQIQMDMKEMESKIETKSKDGALQLAFARTLSSCWRSVFGEVEEHVSNIPQKLFPVVRVHNVYVLVPDQYLNDFLSGKITRGMVKVCHLGEKNVSGQMQLTGYSLMLKSEREKALMLLAYANRLVNNPDVTHHQYFLKPL
jgi:hypothetical protein